MEVLEARRVQLGERLRGLAARYEQLEYQAERHQERVERVRRLYGLPELAAAGAGARAVRPAAPSIFAAAILHVGRLESRVESILSAVDSLLVSLASWEREHAEEAATVPARLPIRAFEAVPVAFFGRRNDPLSDGLDFHAGVDLAAPAGATIFAPAGGVVRWAGEAPASSGPAWWRLGRTVVIAHGDRYRTLFGHCDRVLVRVGQKVASGQPVATVGGSGQAASPRLHYEVRRRDADGVWVAVDPLGLLLEIERFESELGARLPGPSPSDGPAAPPLPASFAR